MQCFTSHNAEYNATIKLPKENWKNISFWEGYSNDNVLLNEANKNMIWKSDVFSDVLHKLPDMK